MANKTRGVCQIDGHSLASVKTGEAIEPHYKLIVSLFAIICTKCGQSLEEVRRELPTIVKGKSDDPQE